MKIKEGGVMDIQKERDLYLAELLEREVITQDEFRDLVFKPEINAFDSNYLSSRFIDKINFGWSAWQAKAQAVPDLSELQERIAGHQYYHDEHGHMVVDMDDVVKEISGFDSWKSQAVPEKDVVIKKLSDQLYAQEMKASAARVLCETACELLDDYAHQDAMVILDDLEQAMKEPVND